MLKGPPTKSNEQLTKLSHFNNKSTVSNRPGKSAISRISEVKSPSQCGDMIEQSHKEHKDKHNDSDSLDDVLDRMPRNRKQPSSRNSKANFDAPPPFFLGPPASLEKPGSSRRMSNLRPDTLVLPAISKSKEQGRKSARDVVEQKGHGRAQAFLPQGVPGKSNH